MAWTSGQFFQKLESVKSKRHGNDPMKGSHANRLHPAPDPVRRVARMQSAAVGCRTSKLKVFVCGMKPADFFEAEWEELALNRHLCVSE